MPKTVVFELRPPTLPRIRSGLPFSASLNPTDTTEVIIDQVRGFFAIHKLEPISFRNEQGNPIIPSYAVLTHHQTVSVHVGFFSLKEHAEGIQRAYEQLPQSSVRIPSLQVWKDPWQCQRGGHLTQEIIGRDSRVRHANYLLRNGYVVANLSQLDDHILRQILLSVASFKDAIAFTSTCRRLNNLMRDTNFDPVLTSLTSRLLHRSDTFHRYTEIWDDVICLEEPFSFAMQLSQLASQERMEKALLVDFENCTICKASQDSYQYYVLQGRFSFFRMVSSRDVRPKVLMGFLDRFSSCLGRGPPSLYDYWDAPAGCCKSKLSDTEQTRFFRAIWNLQYYAYAKPLKDLWIAGEVTASITRTYITIWGTSDVLREGSKRELERFAKNHNVLDLIQMYDLVRFWSTWFKIHPHINNIIEEVIEELVPQLTIWWDPNGLQTVYDMFNLRPVLQSPLVYDFVYEDDAQEQG